MLECKAISMLPCFQVFLRGGSHTEVEVVQGEFKRASENKELGVFLLEGACTLLHKLAMISASHGDYCTVFAFSVLEGFTWQELAQLQRESLKLRHMDDMDDMAWQFDTLGISATMCNGKFRADLR